MESVDLHDDNFYHCFVNSGNTNDNNRLPAQTMDSHILFDFVGFRLANIRTFVIQNELKIRNLMIKKNCVLNLLVMS